MNARYGSRSLIRWFGLVTALAAGMAAAQSGVVVTNAWARATVPGQKVGAVYMEMRAIAPARLLSAASPAAGRTEIHQMKMESGVMKMSTVDVMDLPAGKSVKLEPGGYHLMLTDLKRALKAGESVPVLLTFESSNKTRQTVEIKAEVRSLPGVHSGH